MRDIQPLIDYVESSRAGGVPDDVIKESILQQGSWTAEEFSKAMGYVEPTVPSVPYESSQSNSDAMRLFTPNIVLLFVVVVILGVTSVYMSLSGTLIGGGQPEIEDVTQERELVAVKKTPEVSTSDEGVQLEETSQVFDTEDTEHVATDDFAPNVVGTVTVADDYVTLKLPPNNKYDAEAAFFIEENHTRIIETQESFDEFYYGSNSTHFTGPGDKFYEEYERAVYAIYKDILLTRLVYDGGSGLLSAKEEQIIRQALRSKTVEIDLSLLDFSSSYTYSFLEEYKVRADLVLNYDSFDSKTIFAKTKSGSVAGVLHEMLSRTNHRSGHTSAMKDYFTDKSVAVVDKVEYAGVVLEYERDVELIIFCKEYIEYLSKNSGEGSLTDTESAAVQDFLVKLVSYSNN